MLSQKCRKKIEKIFDWAKTTQILFKPLTLDEVTGIVELQINDLNKRLVEHRVTMQDNKAISGWQKRSMTPSLVRALLSDISKVTWRQSWRVQW
jgi:ATP-dependent Clp protease ATP-binding subunit ClpA